MQHEYKTQTSCTPYLGPGHPHQHQNCLHKLYVRANAATPERCALRAHGSSLSKLGPPHLQPSLLPCRLTVPIAITNQVGTCSLLQKRPNVPRVSVGWLPFCFPKPGDVPDHGHFHIACSAYALRLPGCLFANNPRQQEQSVPEADRGYVCGVDWTSDDRADLHRP